MANAAQIRAARGLLDLDQSQLARAVGVSGRTIIRLERGLPTRNGTVAAIEKVLERRGVEFIEENGGGPGVRLRRRSKRS